MKEENILVVRGGRMCRISVVSPWVHLEGEKKASIDENMEHEEGTYLWIMTRSKLHSDDRQRDFQVEWQTIVQMDGAVFQV